jgi:methylthioribulose-1-phosphate dehydratase
MMAPGDIAELRQRLIETVGGFHARGWSDGTGGNYSVLVSRDPFRMLITASGVDKGRLTPEQILDLDHQNQVLSGEGKPSAETGLHRAIYDTVPDAWAVLHTHSPACTVMSERHRREGVIAITGLEMLKGLRGVTSHNHVEYLPVLENSQDIDALAVRFAVRLTADPRIHAFLLAGHGLTTWGRDLVEARRHVEILEFLLEVQFRRELLG